MSNFIIPMSSLPSISSITDLQGKQGGKIGASGDGFAGMLQNAMGDLVKGSETTSKSMYDLAVGANDDLHTGAIESLKYSASVSYVSGVTRAVINSYNELMRMAL